jgi:hypothetical protein
MHGGCTQKHYHVSSKSCLHQQAIVSGTRSQLSSPQDRLITSSGFYETGGAPPSPRRRSTNSVSA